MICTVAIIAVQHLKHAPLESERRFRIPVNVVESMARALQHRWELVHTQTRPYLWIVQVTAKPETVRLQVEVQMNITM